MSENYNFAMVPARCFTDRNLKYMHMALLGLIASYRHRETGWCYPSLSTLAEDLGLSPSSGPSQVSKAIKVLKELRYIDVIHGGGEQSSQYRVIDEAPGGPKEAEIAEMDTPQNLRGGAQSTTLGVLVGGKLA